MRRIMEPLFCVFYLIFTIIIGILILKKSNRKKEFILFGIMSLVLVFGDSFHLVPRIIHAIDASGDYHMSLGIGKMITSITMTFFYLMMYFFYEIRYKKRNIILGIIMTILSITRIVLCLIPQNDWTGDAPVLWGIIRNIPFTIMGLIVVALFFIKRSDKTFRFMWLAITLSFAFYIPVVLFADKNAIIGMLMIPKTIMYIWSIMMGYKMVKKEDPIEN